MPLMKLKLTEQETWSARKIVPKDEKFWVSGKSFHLSEKQLY